jgi:hypothetical protein
VRRNKSIVCLVPNAIVNWFDLVRGEKMGKW